MSATVQQIARFLDQHYWKYNLRPNKESIITGVVAENVDPLLIIINLKESKNNTKNRHTSID